MKMKIVSSQAKSGPPDAESEFRDWVDPYLRDELDPGQTERFEHALISDPKLQQLTREAYVLNELSREFPEQLAVRDRLWQRPLFGYAMAASLGAAVVAAPAWWVQDSLRDQHSELALQLQQAQTSLAEIATPQAGLAVLRLGTTRSGETNDALLRQSAQVRWAQLILPQVAPDGSPWPSDAQVLLQTEQGATINSFSLGAMDMVGGPSLLLPIQSLSAGRYTIAVVEIDTLLGAYAFRLAAESNQ